MNLKVVSIIRTTDPRKTPYFKQYIHIKSTITARMILLMP